MAITHPHATKFCNERIRPTSDLITSFYWSAKKLVDEWFNTGVSMTITNDITSIDDGSSIDGRTPLMGEDIHNFISNLQTFIANYEANNNAVLNVITKPSVNGTARF